MKFEDYMLLKSLIMILLGVIIGIPLILYPLLYFFQDSLIFHRQNIDNARLTWIREKFPNSERFIPTPDNTRLHGWFVKRKVAKKTPLLIYFGGNAEEVSNFLIDIDRFRGLSVLVVNYRGYGLSEGTPSESGLFSDALFLYDTFSGREDIDDENIFVMGRSLGTGVGVYLASKRRLKGIILVSPYDSLRSVAQDIYFFAPVSIILKHHFDSLSLASSITTPLLALIGSDDTIIPPSHSRKLVEGWGGRSTLKIVRGADHNSISIGEEFWEHVTQFLLELRKE